MTKSRVNLHDSVTHLRREIIVLLVLLPTFRPDGALFYEGKMVAFDLS